MTIPIYVDLFNLLWAEDGYDYRHERGRVDAATMLNTLSYTSARLQKVCGALYLTYVSNTGGGTDSC